MTGAAMLGLALVKESGAFLALAMSLDDFVISFFVYGAGEGTLPIKIYSSVKVGVSPQVNALCTLIMGVVFIAVALSRYLSSMRAARQSGRYAPRKKRCPSHALRCDRHRKEKRLPKLRIKPRKGEEK